MKKFTSVLLAFALLLCLLPVSARAAASDYKLYMTFDKEYYEVGDTVTATLHLDRVGSTDSYQIYSFECGLRFKPLYLQYTDSSANSANAAGFRIGSSISSYNSNYKMVSINYNGLGTTNPISRPAALVLAQLTFKALANVSSENFLYYGLSLRTGSVGTEAAVDAQPGVYKIGAPKPTFKVSFSGGAGASGEAPSVADKSEGDMFTLPDNPYTLEGSTFTGWSDGTAAFSPGAKYTMPAHAVSFTAQWTKNPVKHHLTFLGGSGATGTAPTMGDSFAGDKIALPTQGSLALTGCTFSGWKTGSAVYQSGELFTMPDEDVSFTAQWTKAEDSGSADGSDADGWSNPFSDVARSSWYYSAVSYVEQKGLMGSVGGSRFDPNGLMTRAMIVTILYRMAGSPAVAAANPFKDVSDSQWYARAVIWASSKGLVNGYGDGRFGPTDTLTREQMLAILWRNAGSPAASNASAAAAQFSDWSSIGSWAVGAAAWAVENAVVNGISGRFVPGGSATRAQFAAILARL